MSNETVLRIQTAFVIGVIVVGALLHFFHIGYPRQPVSDEAHFATYAADYARGTPHLDIHPPLGKALYSFVLYFYPQERYEGVRFGMLEKKDQGIEYRPIIGSYGAFPYAALRGLGAFFGIILPVLVFFFLKRLFPGGVFAPYFGSFFVLFENSLLVDTRLILMNGMFLAFGFAALCALMKYGQRPWIGGAVFGLALGVKFTAIIFAGASAMVIALMEGKKKIHRFIFFSCGGVCGAYRNISFQ
ncbi:phospholipid carrier-dependent glycosyltransferase [Candidatus Azambacteria bacterium]|nr:phospholipid carrier-dependent glycosyltransferase [Candidatus Azambacteria bacterium]